jgi:hypothetical protein
VVPPQQLKVLLGGLQGLRRLTVNDYERAGGALGLEALYLEQQINGTARKINIDPAKVRALLKALIDPLSPAKTRSCSRKDLIEAAATDDGQPIAGEKVDQTIEELERGEIVRSADGWAYRLDHDYLTRGIIAADRRANRWRYLLEEGARTFERAGSVSTRWRALLPISAQIALVCRRLRGSFRYGAQRNYALAGLARLIPALAIIALSGGIWAEYVKWQNQMAARDIAVEIWRKFEFRNGIGKQDLDAAWQLAETNNVLVREKFLEQMLQSPEYSERFLRQPKLVAQALIGINPELRDAAWSMVAPVLQRVKDHTSNVHVIAAAAALANEIQRNQTISPTVIINGLRFAQNGGDSDPIKELFSKYVIELTSDQAQQTADLILSEFQNAASNELQSNLIYLSGDLQSRLSIEDRQRIVHASTLLDSARDYASLVVLSSGLSRLAPNTTSQGAAIVDRLIMDRISGAISQKSSNRFRNSDLPRAFIAFAPKLSPSDADSLAETIIAILNDQNRSAPLTLWLNGRLPIKCKRLPI